MRIKQSVCIPMLNMTQAPLADFVRRVAGMGFPAVEIWMRDETLGELAALCRQYNLVISQMSGHDGIANGLNNAGQHERIEAELCASIDVAAELGIPGLICFSGNRRAGQPEEDAIETAAAGLRRVAPYAEKKGVNLNMELLNTIVDHAGYQCEHTAWGVAVCQKVNSPRVKLLYDIYHMQIMEGNLIATIQQNIRWIGHFHMGGVPGRHDIDEAQEINYAQVCRSIAASGYDLYMGHEYRPVGEVYQALQKAYSICNQG
jgi:hydroxypyruvate isomerase